LTKNQNLKQAQPPTQAICICGVEKIARCLRSVRAFPSSDRKAHASPQNAVSPLRWWQG